MRALISYVSNDARAANQLVDHLSNDAIEARMDNIYIASKGSHKPQFQAIADQLEKYDFVVALLSKEYLRRDWMRKELSAAVTLQQSSASPFLIPLLLEEGCTLPAFCPEPINAKADISAAYAELSRLLTGFRQMFVIMKFNDDALTSAFATAIEPAAHDFGLEAFTIEGAENSNPLPPQILRAIERSRIVLADLTGDRPNCYFEAGYALGQRKEIILTCREGDKPHFDVADRKIIYWKTEIDLKRNLSSRLTQLRGDGAIH